ncbi:hypothetical protein BDZ91DRAFT_536390 [Kalaharituber pfeilii]|nr:hypothetical protein BDZ91DRAFT_536390 [Kalaharituber pfeilii]
MVLAAARYAIRNLPKLNEDLAAYLLQYMASMLSSIYHLSEFASLIREYPDAALVLLRLTPNAPSTSRLSTVNIKTWGQWNPQTPAGPIYWTKPNQGQLPLPSLAFALTGIDASFTDNIKLYATYKWVEKHLNPIYNTILDSGTTIIYGAWCRWLEIPAEHSILRTGTYNMTEPLTNAGGPKLIPIQFSQPFVRNAKVVLFINGMHFDKNYNRRINVEVVDATEKGFTLKLSTWEDTIVLGLGVTWVAYPEGTPGITSGVVNTSRSQKNPQQEHAWYKSFVGEAVFRSTPKIFIGFHNCDIGAGTASGFGQRLSRAQRPTSMGSCGVQILGSDTKMYSTGLAYLAFDPNLGEDEDLSAGTPV